MDDYSPRDVDVLAFLDSHAAKKKKKEQNERVEEGKKKGLKPQKVEFVSALQSVIKCKTCKGKGWLYRRNQPDEMCQCRVDAYELLAREREGKDE